MPIGKNSIKRVATGGYSAVKTSAPDMENSTVLTNPAPEVVSLVVSSATKNQTAKKTAAKKAASKAPASSKKAVSANSSAANKAPAKKQKAALSKEEDRFGKVALGDAMPEYLL